MSRISTEQCVQHPEENKTQMRRTEFSKKSSHNIVSLSLWVGGWEPITILR